MPKEIPCVIMRGGTSKGVFIHDKDLPRNESERIETILKIFGSPDPRQIDGLGGADPLTSKVAIIKKSDREDADIDYTFGQVSVDRAEVRFENNCGNISSAVGPFAINERLVDASEPYTQVRIFNTNTSKIIHAKVLVENDIAKSEGDFSIDGVPGQGAEIVLTFFEPTGAITGRLLPTGNVMDSVPFGDSHDIEVSIVDSGTLYAFIEPHSINLTGNESAEDIENNKTTMDVINNIRKQIARYLFTLNVFDEKKASLFETSLKMALVSRCKDPSQNEETENKGAQIIAKIINPTKVHKAYAVTGAICLGSGAYVKGTILEKIIKKDERYNDGNIIIRHPKGTIDVAISKTPMEEGIKINTAGVKRTARMIMKGVVYV